MRRRVSLIGFARFSRAICGGWTQAIGGEWILGTGSALPKRVVTNDDLSDFLDTSDEWIFTRTGIKERRICTEETLDDLAMEASNRALDMAGVAAGDLDLIVCSTTTGDHLVPAESYLNEDAVLTTAVKSGAKTIHPGYGFFSENAGFVRECEKCGLAFVGPSAEVIDRMGDKDAARRTAKAAGVPVIPGCDLLKSPEEAEREARRIGCPVLIKARSGGGGRGIRKVERAGDAGRAFSEARAEAEAAFGDGSFYFMEMNTRLQVEHPVTEFVTDVDLVKWQLRVAAGQALSFEREDLPVAGHAMECRINAETPDYLPSCGTVTMLHVPGGPKVCFDSALFPGAVVPPYYDSMLARVIVCASTRDGAIRKMRSALGELVIEGVDENSELQLRILANEEFLSGNYHTNLMEGINAAQ